MNGNPLVEQTQSQSNYPPKAGFKVQQGEHAESSAVRGRQYTKYVLQPVFNPYLLVLLLVHYHKELK